MTLVGIFCAILFSHFYRVSADLERKYIIRAHPFFFFYYGAGGRDVSPTGVFSVPFF